MSQCSLILHALRTARGKEVAMPALVEASGGYAIHSRVAELRKRGHTIACRVIDTAGDKHSFYRLIEPSPVAPVESSTTRRPLAAQTHTVPARVRAAEEIRGVTGEERSGT